MDFRSLDLHECFRRTAGRAPTSRGAPAGIRSLRPDRSGEPTCTRQQIAAAFRNAQTSLVYVTAAGGAGLGFSVHDARHVVVPLGVVATARDVAVSRGSLRRQGTVVAVDDERNLAVVRLTLPLKGLKPLRLGAVQPFDHGTPVLATGRTFEDDQPVLSITPGVVTSKGDKRWSTNALVSFHQTYGGPLLDCDSRVVGLAASWWGDDVTPAEAVSELLASMTEQVPYQGEVSMAHASVGMALQFAPGEAWVGISAGTAITVFDQWHLPLRVGVLGMAGPEVVDEATRDDWVRLQVETGVGYRVLLSSGEVTSYLVPAVGAAMSHDWGTRRRSIAQVTSSECSPAAPCDVERRTESTDLGTRLKVSPTVGLGLLVGPGGISYGAHIDVEDPSQTTHQVVIGAQF